MSYDLDEDISILNINELDEDFENCRLDDPQATNSSCRLEASRIKQLNALVLCRQSVPCIKSDRNKYSMMSRPEELLKELHDLRESNRSLQQECTSMRESRLSAQKECLQLREKVSFLFRENCSLKEHSAKLTIDNCALQKQVESLKQSNTRLKDRLQQFSHQLKCFVQNKDACGNSSSPVLSHQVEQVKLMLDFISNLPKCIDDSKDCSLVNDKKDISKTHQGGSLFSLELDHENIEQISHKLLEHLQQEKKELEQQYSQMVEIQKQSISCGVTESLQSCLASNNIGEKEVLALLETCRNNTKQIKQEAMIQNNLMTAMIKQMALTGTLQKTLLELNPDMHMICKKSTDVAVNINDNQDDQTDLPSECKENKKTDSTSTFSKCNDAPIASSASNMDALWLTYGKDIPEWENSDAGMNQCKGPLEYTNSSTEDDRICPMCQAVFPKRIPLPEFEAHVMEHFKSEEFEIITQDNDYG